MSIKIALIVPTKDRPEDLNNLFVSIQKQTRSADLVIVVDGSDDPIEYILKDFKNK